MLHFTKQPEGHTSVMTTVAAPFEGQTFPFRPPPCQVSKSFKHKIPDLLWFFFLVIQSDVLKTLDQG